MKGALPEMEPGQPEFGRTTPTTPRPYIKRERSTYQNPQHTGKWAETFETLGVAFLALLGFALVIGCCGWGFWLLVTNR